MTTDFLLMSCSNIGHTESAAGVAGLLKVLAMIKYGGIPPQPNHHRLNPKIPAIEPEGMAISKTLRSWDVPLRTALVNSYGAGGSNCALVCCEMPRSRVKPQTHLPNVQKLSMPVMISAASRDALRTNAQVLATYLSKHSHELELSDVAYTLNQRRKRHRFVSNMLVSDIPELVNGLNAVDGPKFEYPNNPKPIIMMLSGQYDSKVALDRRVYDAYPEFKAYLDACNDEITSLGYPSIFPAVFQSSTSTGAVSLQSCIFAVQYASARCWLDAGLQPDAVIGHSLGEIVALAVSGALSLRNCLELLTFRAQLVDTKWGPDPGAMLAIYAGPDEVDRLLAQMRTSSRDGVVEVACYNAPTSIVVSGPSSSISLAEQKLRERFPAIKWQRLATTSAFHSSLTEPILPDLETFTGKLDWKKPTIPLETCTSAGLSSLHEWNPSKHAREPVYFSNAVQRVEQRYGSCVWLEVGFNTPVIPMTKRACVNTAMHTFQSVSYKNMDQPCECISTVVSELWRQGISLSHWSFLGRDSPSPTPVWLPPYKFSKNQHSVEGVDRAMEAQKKLEAIPQTLQQQVSPIRPGLVSKVAVPASQHPGPVLFAVNTKSERFQEVVKGHAVLGVPLCPAPMHLECCTMAIQILCGNVEKLNLAFEDLQFVNPLGLDPAREVELFLEEIDPNRAWKFSVCSRIAGSTGEPLVHCLGVASLPRSVGLATYTRLVQSTINKIEASETVERLKSKRVYGLFLRVMHYAPFFKGISSLAVDGDEAVASIKLPEDQPGRHDSVVWHRCDTVLIDAFISTVGLLLNSSDAVSDEEILIAVGIEQVILASACQMETRQDWLVYAKFASSQNANGQLIGDVYVCTSDHEVVAMMVGVQFAKVDVSKFKKMLLSANAMQAPAHVAQPSPKDYQVPAPATASRSATGSTSKPGTDIPTPPETNVSEGVKEIISNYTGLHPDDIPHNVVLVDLGIDSLSAIECAAEMQTAFGVEVASTDLGEMTLDDLIIHLGGQDSLTAPKDVSVPNAGPPSTIRNGAPPTPPEDDDDSIEPTAAKSHLKSIANRPGPSSTDSFNPFEALLYTDTQFPEAAEHRGYKDYHSQVFPLQNNLTVAYILEAFKTLGLDILSISPGSVIPPLSNVLPKHDKLTARLWKILQEQGIVSKKAIIVIRGRKNPETGSSAEFYEQFSSQFPNYLPEARLIKMMGEQLARCMNGEQDPLALMFGTPQSSKIMEDYYGNSPMVSTLTDQLVTFVLTLFRNKHRSDGSPFRILEVGAGTGGTTRRLVDKLQASGIQCEYTFTDIAGRMVSKAKDKFRSFSWMSFDTFDLEKGVREKYRNRFDLVIGTNCVHATSSRIASTRRLLDTLNDDGVVVLSEGTQPLPWFDIVFGVLDGWWLAENGTEYPLQPASKWMEVFQAAGYSSFSFTRGATQEAYTQQLLIGSKARWSIPISSVPTAPEEASDSYRLETVVYKEVSGVQVHADIYVPRQATTSPRPVGMRSLSLLHSPIQN